MENRHCGAEADSGLQGPGGLQVGSAGPTWHPLSLRLSVESSQVFWNLLVSVSLQISAINSDMQVHLDGFLDKPYRKYRFTKLMKFVSLNPYTFVGDYIYALMHVTLMVYNIS